MRRFSGATIALVFLTIAACTDSSIDSEPVASQDSTEASPNDPSEPISKAETAESAHHKHQTTSHPPHESPAAKSQKHPGHSHGHQEHVPSTTDHPVGIAIGEFVPDFEVMINGTSRQLSELQEDASLTEDGTLAFTFWCSFCHSCRDVEADLDKLATRYKGKVGVIALDASAGDTAEAITKIVTKKGLSLPIALNPDGSAADLFGITKTTTTVVIDSRGVLRYRGRFQEDEQAYADNAIIAVLAGSDVVVKETAQRG